tara:strand:- start:1769 stop:1921 length:153 start_codon:yes stop_codon:yes gene_type:complete
MTLSDGLTMALFMNSIGLLIFAGAYYIAFRNHEEKMKKEEEDKQPKPWEI